MAAILLFSCTMGLVSYIEVVNPPLRTEYSSNMVFDPEGLVISLVYHDGSAIGIKYADDNMVFYKAGERLYPLVSRIKTSGNIEVNYGGMSSTFPVQVI